LSAAYQANGVFVRKDCVVRRPRVVKVSRRSLNFEACSPSKGKALISSIRSRVQRQDFSKYGALLQLPAG
jgi:hypothetical protein